MAGSLKELWTLWMHGPQGESWADSRSLPHQPTNLRREESEMLEIPDVSTLEAARALVQHILDRNRQQELHRPWPDTKEALAEPGVIFQAANTLMEDETDGHSFLRRLEEMLSRRWESYVSDAEYSSDKGRLGSVLSDVRSLIRETGSA